MTFRSVCGVCLVCAAAVACSSQAEQVARRHSDEGAEPAPSDSGETRGNLDAHSSLGSASEGDNIIADASGVGANGAEPDAGADQSQVAFEPWLSIAFAVGTLGETVADVSLFFGAESKYWQVSASIISPPALEPDPENPWPPMPPESEWDRSETPIGACTVVFKGLETSGYDLTGSSLAFPSDGRHIVLNNFRDPDVGWDHPCTLEPGCPYPYNRGVDWYYLTPEGSDLRLVICGNECSWVGGDKGQLSVALTSATTPCTD